MQRTELKFHRPVLSDADIEFLMGIIAEKHHRLKVTAEMLEEDLKELDRRTDMRFLSNIEIIETDFQDLNKKKYAIKLEAIKLWRELSILEGYFIKFERMVNGKASKGGRSPAIAQMAFKDVHRRWHLRKQREEANPCCARARKPHFFYYYLDCV